MDNVLFAEGFFFIGVGLIILLAIIAMTELLGGEDEDR
jgi:hypothetical protein